MGPSLHPSRRRTRGEPSLRTGPAPDLLSRPSPQTSQKGILAPVKRYWSERGLARAAALACGAALAGRAARAALAGRATRAASAGRPALSGRAAHAALASRAARAARA